MQSLETMPAAEVEELSYSQHLVEQHEETTTQQRREVIKRLLQKLPESECTVVTLHTLGEMSCDEISQFLGVSPNTIKSRLHRARKRLKKQEHLIREALGSFQLAPTLTENILQEMSRIKPTPPATSKPLGPWAIAASTAVLVGIMLSIGNQPLARFQQPYNLDATSEMTVAIVDTSVVLNLVLKPAVRNQLGHADAPGRGNGNAGPKAAAHLITAAPADEVPFSKPKPQWIQTKGPGGVSRPGSSLHLRDLSTLLQKQDSTGSQKKQMHGRLSVPAVQIDSLIQFPLIRSFSLISRKSLLYFFI